MRDPVEIIKTVAKDTSPFLHPLILHYWMNIFGTSEVAIRSLSFIFYFLTVVTAYFIGKTIENKKTGLLVALMVVVNPFLFAYAFEGRMYSLLLFTSTLSTYFFLTRKPWLHALATAAALYTHHFSLTVIGIQGIWTFFQALTLPKKSNFVKSIFSRYWSFGLALLIYSPWLPTLYQQTQMVISGFWLPKPSFSDLTGLYSSFVIGSHEGIVRLILLGLVGTILIFRKWRQNKWQYWFCLSWFLIPTFLVWLFSQFKQSIFFDRYLLASIPGGLFFLVSRRRGWYSLAPIILLMVFLFWYDWQYFGNPTRRPFRELADYVKQTRQPGDELVNWNTTAHHLWELKYYQIPAPIYADGVTELPFFVGTALMQTGDIIQKLPNAPRLGIIYSGDPGMIEVDNYEIMEEKKFGDLTFQWWRF
ncbi:glycosyltransferase family 39 protein [Candidatus Collierbacteria bacterium]|nr:glycosyltransferase family 39 protein [Candidatus Collierbacteria bacterium]